MYNLPPIKAELRELVDQYGLSAILKTLCSISVDKQEEIGKEWAEDPRVSAWRKTESELQKTIEKVW